jgi:hypothetical protein
MLGISDRFLNDLTGFHDDMPRGAGRSSQLAPL